jgi:hypothetical protein
MSESNQPNASQPPLGQAGKSAYLPAHQQNRASGMAVEAELVCVSTEDRTINHLQSFMARRMGAKTQSDVFQVMTPTQT